jgi:hypothetical protein
MFFTRDNSGAIILPIDTVHTHTDTITAGEQERVAFRTPVRPRIWISLSLSTIYLYLHHFLSKSRKHFFLERDHCTQYVLYVLS